MANPTPLTHEQRTLARQLLREPWCDGAAIRAYDREVAARALERAAAQIDPESRFGQDGLIRWLMARARATRGGYEND